MRRRQPPEEPDSDRLDYLGAGLRMAERLAAVSSGEWREQRLARADMLRGLIAEEEARGA